MREVQKALDLARTDEELLAILQRTHSFLNDRYDHIRNYFIEFDLFQL